MIKLSAVRVRVFAVAFLCALVFFSFVSCATLKDSKQVVIADNKKSSVSLSVTPYSLNIIDFYKADYLPENNLKKTYLSNYGLNAGLSYQYRFNEKLEISGGLGYVYSKYNNAVLPNAVNYHYANARVGANYILPMKSNPKFEFTFGGFGGALVGFNAGLVSVNPFVSAKVGCRYYIKPDLSLGLSLGADMAFYTLDESIKNSFTFIISPATLGVTYAFAGIGK